MNTARDNNQRYHSEMENSQCEAKDIACILSKVDKSISNKIQCNEAMLIQLADTMAENATAFSGQGYTNFLQSRQKFIDTLTQINKEYEQLLLLLHPNKV